MPGTKLEASPNCLSKPTTSFYAWVLNEMFMPMTLGKLTIRLPDGRNFIYGKGQEGVTANIEVRDPKVFKKCFWTGDVGFGEAYVDGYWDTKDVTKVIEWMITNAENHPTLMGDEKKRKPVNWLKLFNILKHVLRMNTLQGSRKNISAHYDLSNEFFRLFLDPTMTYSSAYFKQPDMGLKEAQIQKYDSLCQKLRLKTSDRVLEIGSGWGGFAMHAAKNYGCHVTTITVSQQQHDYAQKMFSQEGLNDRIDIQLIDYRHMTGKFDKIVSIEMIEAVGDKFLDIYFSQCQNLLKREGLLGLQMILSPDHRYDSFRENVDWIQKHIFPGSLLPSMNRIMKALNSTGQMCLFDYEDITMHYVKTLAIWRDNFNSQNARIRELGFDEAFARKWNYYFSYCEAAFKTRNISVAQAVFTRPNNLNIS